METAVLLPVKDSRRGKQRLSTVLSPGERAALAWAMFEDVCSALERTGLPVAVVTDWEAAAARARQNDWLVLWETAQISESASVDAASAQLSKDGFPAVLRLPADIPLVQSGDVQEIHALARSHAAVAVPSRDGTGTNAILRFPPNLFRSRFGPNSFALHRAEADRAGASFTAVQNCRIGLDLDEASDLDCFFQLGSVTHTHGLLVKIGWGERMGRLAAQHLHSGH